MYSKYHEDLEKQKRWFWLRILGKLTAVWGMFVAVFMVVVLFLIILSAPGLAIYQSLTNDICPSAASHNATIDIGDATVLRIISDRGDLSVEGRPGLATIQVEGQICATRESKLHIDSVVLSTSNNGDEIIVSVEMPRIDGNIADDIRMNLVIVVPEDFPGVEIDNVDGPVSVSNVGELRVIAGHGSLDATNIGNSVIVSSLKGSITLIDVGGDVTVGTILEYGKVDLSGIGGNVVIGENRSGPARISNVGGDVTIGSSGYGQLTVSSVAGDLFVGENPGGDISIEQIEGSVRLPENQEAVEESGA